MGSSYIEQRKALLQEGFLAGSDITAQQMFDIMCVALHDPGVMGKDTFGADRLRKLHDAMRQYESFYHEAWMHTEESDYYQEKLDDALREIFGNIEPFKKRYPLCKEWNYNKRSKKG